MKKLIIAIVMAFTAQTAQGQDTTAAINFTWPHYAADTTLTFRQIVTTCDSLFALAGYAVYPDTTAITDTTQGQDTAQTANQNTGANEEPDENSSFAAQR